jgi:hypothetical protein
LRVGTSPAGIDDALPAMSATVPLDAGGAGAVVVVVAPGLVVEVVDVEVVDVEVVDVVVVAPPPAHAGLHAVGQPCQSARGDSVAPLATTTVATSRVIGTWPCTALADEHDAPQLPVISSIPVAGSLIMKRVGWNGELQLNDPFFFHHAFGVPKSNQYTPVVENEDVPLQDSSA